MQVFIDVDFLACSVTNLSHRHGYNASPDQIQYSVTIGMTLSIIGPGLTI